jgi:MFS family permease
VRRSPLAALRGGSLGRQADFNLLWGGQTVSQLGTQVSLLALPLTAVTALGAGAAQMGVLGAMGRLPALLYLVAGVWIDRTRRRPVLIAADVARAAVLLTVPLAALLGVLRIELLYAAVLLVAVLTVWFDIAYMSYVPSLVRQDQLVEGNSRLELSRSVAQVAGPGLGGLLVQALTAPIAVAVDAASFLVSALLVARIRSVEGQAASAGRRGVWREVAEGLRFVVGHPVLRSLAGAIAISNFFWALQLAVYVLYLSRGLGMPAPAIGLVVAATGPGAVLGTLLAGTTVRRAGIGPTVTAGLALFGAAALAFPLAPAYGDAPLASVALLAAAQGTMSLGGQVTAINVLSLRQGITPPALQGRSNASFRFLGVGVSPLGSLAGGLLGSLVALRPTLLVAALGLLLAPALLLLSPVRGFSQPAPQPEGGP